MSALNTSRIFRKKYHGLSCHNGTYGCSTSRYFDSYGQPIERKVRDKPLE
ncbi:hypothetical protein ID850_11125 [Xenorhabdus sp. Flor]|nr:hypothetical protein [Xenorhabdus sp. Flor]MBD2815309.1 hypothetical protein [Xenorhabdus sp. Flor]